MDSSTSDRLAKCFKLLASSQDGEVLAAARAIVKIQQTHKVDLIGLTKDVSSMRKKIQEQAAEISSLRWDKTRYYTAVVELNKQLTILKKRWNVKLFGGK